MGRLQMVSYRTRLAAVLEFMFVQPRNWSAIKLLTMKITQEPNRITSDRTAADNYKKMRIYLSTGIVANAMLAVVVFLRYFPTLSIGLKRKALQVSSIEIAVTVVMPNPSPVARMVSRLMSVFIFEVPFG
jgi:hypothetical protein